ncbi:MAG: MFS transporter [Dehalococcoidia bacterium]
MARASMRARGYRRNVPLFYLVSFLRDFQIWIPVWVVFLTIDQGFSLAQVTTADGLFFVGLTVLEIPTGAVADRWGRSRSVALGALCFALALAFFALTTSFPILLLSFLTWALAMALMSGADLALLYDSLKELGEEASYERHAGAGGATAWAGAAVATLIGGPLAAFYSIELTIWLGVGSAALAAVAALAMKEPPRGRSEHAPGLIALIRRATRLAWGDRVVRWVLLFSGALSAGLGSAHYLVQPYLLANGVAVGGLFSLLQVPQLLGGALGSLVAYRFVRRFGETGVLLGVGAVGVGAYAGVAAISSLGAFAFIPIVALLEAAVIPVATGAVNRRVASSERATVLSMQSFTASLVVAPLAPFVGVVADGGGPRWGFSLLSAVLAAALVAALVAWRVGRSSWPRYRAGPGEEPARGGAQ